MKKLFIVFSLVVATSFAANAQDEGFTSKNGHQVLPETGDYGVTFNANPLLNYVGNLFSQSGTNSLNGNGTFPGGLLTNPNMNINAITFKKFLDANTAIRARVQIGLYSHTTKNLVNKIGSTTGEKVEDKTITKASQVFISAGIEKRRGSSRVQGIYGAELLIGVLSNPNVKNTYGNDLSASNPISRTTETKNGNSLAIGPRAFIGAEFFIAPKLSLGAEFGWAILLQTTAKSQTTTETWNGSGVDTKTTQTSAGPSNIDVNTDNLNGAVNLNFYF